MRAIQKTIHSVILASFIFGMNAEVPAKNAGANGQQECLKQSTLIEIAKSSFYDLQTIDSSITLNDVKAVMASAGDCASYDEINAVLDQYREQLIANSTSGVGDVTTNTAPTLDGMPDSSVTVGNLYNFTPVASDAEFDTLSFSISNQPQWASFDYTTGTLSGMPSAGDVGNYEMIVISVTDGVSSTSLPGFSIDVIEAATPQALYEQIQGYTFYLGTSRDNLIEQGILTVGNTVSDITSVSNTSTYYFSISAQDGTGNNVMAGIPEILGYRIYAGTNSSSLVPVSDLTGGDNSVFVISELVPGTYYMSVTVFDINGNVGPLSNIVKIIVM